MMMMMMMMIMMTSSKRVMVEQLPYFILSNFLQIERGGVFCPRNRATTIKKKSEPPL